MITGIIVALPEEITTLTKSKLNKGEVQVLSDDILLMYSGVGPDNARVAAKQLIKQGAKKLISWGCAAALKNNLKSGDLVLALALISESDSIYQCDRRWQQQVCDLLKQQITVRVENLAESSSIIWSSTQKRALQKKTGAAIADMESTAIAKIATEYSLPFIAICAIADSAAMNLPRSVVVSLDAEGVVQLPRLLRHLLRHPNELPALIRLGQSFSAAKKALCLVAQQLTTIADFSVP